MRTKLSIFILASASLWANGALFRTSHPCCDRYVDPAGSDANSGKTPVQAWQTVAKVNAATLTPYQQIGLKRGGTWRETLTPAQSGTSGSRIVFASYGSGVNPIITGADLTSGTWTQLSTLTGTVTQANLRLSTISGSSFLDFSSAGSLTPYLGSQVTVTDHTGKNAVGYIKAAGSGETFGSELMGNTAFSNTTGIGNASAVSASVPGGQTGNALQIAPTGSFGFSFQNFSATSGMALKCSIYMQLGTETNFEYFNVWNPSSVTIGTASSSAGSFTQAAYYVTADATSAGFAEIYGGATTGLTSLFDTTSIKQVLTPSTTGVTITSTSGGSTFNWASIDSGFNLNDSAGYTYSIAVPGNTWSIALAYTPNQVFFNAQRGTLVASIASIGSPGNWFFGSGTLYVYSTSNPSTAFTMPGVEASHRTNAALIAGQSNLSFSGVSLTAANGDNMLVTGTSNALTFSAISSSYSYQNGIRFYQPSIASQNGMVITASEFSFNQLSGVIQNGYADSWMVQNNLFHDNVSKICAGDFCGGIRFISAGGPTVQEATNITLQYNTAYSNGFGVAELAGLSTGSGLWFDTTGVGNKMFYNTSYNNNDAGLLVEITNGALLAYNVSYGNKDGIRFYNHDTNCLAYNNTLWGSGEADLRFRGFFGGGDLGFTNNVAENNLSLGGVGQSLVADYGGENDGVNGSGNIYLYNGLGVQATNFIEWGAGVSKSTYATWEAASGNCGTTGCSHSMQADPLFVNAGAANFNLQAGSPAIGTGIFISGISTANPPNIGAK